MYPRPDSWSRYNFDDILGISPKNAAASFTVILRTSAILLPLYLISRVSLLYLLPSQTSQVTYTSGRNNIETLTEPAPLHASHLPPLTLKLKRPGEYPLIFAS